MVLAESLLNGVDFLEYYSVARNICMLELLDSHYIFAGMLKIEGDCYQIFFWTCFTVCLFAIEGRIVILATYRCEITLD